MQQMQVRPDYIPDPNNNAIPDNIAGEYYTVYKLALPTANHDLDMHIPYVHLILKTLEDDKQRTEDVLEVLYVLRHDDVDERDVIYRMAKWSQIDQEVLGCIVLRVH